MASRILRFQSIRQVKSRVPHALNRNSMQSRLQSTKPQSETDIEALLREPTWSLKTLYDPPQSSSSSTPPITKEKLHHLLRLSALPLPKSEEEEAKMIKDLQAQLKFVQAIQEVDTTGVEPLQAIRDETEEARKRSTITIESLQEEFAKEEVVGKRGRIRSRKVPHDDQHRGPPKLANGKTWDPLSHASKTQGRYFVVDTAKD